MKIRRSLLKDTVAVQTYSGDSAYGPVYAATKTIPCNIEPTRRLVRSASGDEVVSEATLYVHPYDAVYFAPESLVTIDGRASRILAANAQTYRGRTSYLKVTCA